MKKQIPWIKGDYEELNINNFNLLLENKIPFLRIPMFITDEERKEFLKQIKDYGFSYYEDVDPPIGRIGTTVFENQGTSRIYFERANHYYEDLRKRIPAHGNVMSRLKTTITKNSHKRCHVAIGNEGRYFAGLIRIMFSGALLHIDYAPFDANKYSIKNVSSQLAWNLFLEMPKNGGGECLIYNRQWTIDDEKFKNKEDYGYNRSLVNNCEKISVKPNEGEIILFNSRNFHEVLANRDTNEKRIALSSFIGKLNNEEIIFWS